MRAFQNSLGQLLADKNRFLNSTIFSSRILRIALVTMAGLSGTATAQAAVFWTDDDPMVMSQPEEPAPQPRPKRPRRVVTRSEKPAREASKPVGPLVIAISIDRQTLKLYDANGLYAETPVSTGMAGHTTPMGVFSVIQKQKFHRSNIYSDAPMPFMQRITWSGIAMHAGVLPGHPASHGCIRMPMAFAVKMYGWTRMGARVVIVPGDVSPSDISHPLLIAHKPEPTPVADAAPEDATPVAKVDVAVPQQAVQAMSSDSLQLKPGVDADRARAAADLRRNRDQSQTADASGVIGQSARSDASAMIGPDRNLVTRRDVDAAAAKTIDLALAEAKAPPIAPSEAKPSEDKPSEDKAPVAAQTDAQPSEAARPDMPKAEATKPAAPDAAPAIADIMKDDSHPAAAAKTETAPASPAAAADVAPKRTGQISVLISRKDGKLYVRQNYAPLFDVPVTIAASDRPLGTHVFTARADKDDAKAFHWSVVSLPMARRAERSDADDNVTRRRKSAGAIEMKSTPVPDSAAEALDRITIPDDAKARIADALANGTSIIVSDLGIASGGETGQGTEFVVPLR